MHSWSRDHLFCFHDHFMEMESQSIHRFIITASCESQSITATPGNDHVTGVLQFKEVSFMKLKLTHPFRPIIILQLVFPGMELQLNKCVWFFPRHLSSSHRNKSVSKHNGVVRGRSLSLVSRLLIGCGV